MRTLRIVSLAAGILAVIVFSPGMVAAHAANHAPTAARQLPTNPRSPAFRFGLQGSFTTVGTFTVTIYVDGRVMLTKTPRTSSMHLVNPKATIFPVALTGLLKLATAEGFFAMPSKIVPKQVVSDLGTAFITIYTRTGTKSVAVTGNSSQPFYELYSLLNYVAGATS